MLSYRLANHDTGDGVPFAKIHDESGNVVNAFESERYVDVVRLCVEWIAENE